VVDESVVNGVRRYLRGLLHEGVPVSFGVVFGSQVTGRADQWSDVDLIVVSPRFDGPYAREELNRLWHVAARTDDRIEPIPCGEKQWDEDTFSPIIEIARREGTRIDTPDGP
jgi:predicted nucleotidyltransferase